MSASIDLVHQLAQPDSALRDMPLLLVVAHPDDEVLGAGSRLPHLRKLHIVYATDGSPSDMSDARRSGFATSQDYAHARVREAEAARALLDVDPDRVFRLGLRDQDVAYEMTALSRSCAELIDEFQPAAVLTHAYEGGHPDHDAVALAVHLACRRRSDSGSVPPHLIEFAGYHDPDGSACIATQEFLPAPGPRVSLCLNPDELARKRRALACFRTQQHVLRLFRADRKLSARHRAAGSADRPTLGGHSMSGSCAAWTGRDGAGLASRTLRAHGITGPL